MGTTTTLVTVQEFLALPEVEGERLELIGGEIVSMPMSGQPHEVTKSNLVRLLILGLTQNPALRVFIESACQLDETNCLIPDISVLTSKRILPGGIGVFQGAPEIAIEVVSSETAARLEEKIELYLSCGCKSVWVVYPRRRVVRVYDSDGGATKFENGQPLTDPNVLPSFSIPTSAIFDGV